MTAIAAVMVVRLREIVVSVSLVAASSTSNLKRCNGKGVLRLRGLPFCGGYYDGILRKGVSSVQRWY